MFYSLWKRLVLVFSLGFILVNYQNCSSAPGYLLNNNTALANDSGMGKADVSDESQEVGVIDPVSVGAISFPQTEVSVEDISQPFSFIGICEQDGSLISWKLYRGDILLERGLVPCETGSFEITIDQPLDNHCEEGELVLSAALGAKASAEVSIFNSCSDSE